jgi:hypothetical protein
MEITSLVSLVIILFIIFLVLSSKPSKMEKFEEKKADLVIDQKEFIDFRKFEGREPTYAKYGSERENIDVIKIIKDKYGIWKSQRFQVTNGTMEGDPNPGDVKTLRIWYNDSNNNNNNVDLTFKEGALIEFESLYREPVHAKYGSEGKSNNVTQIIKDKYAIWKSNRFQVTNDNMKENPNPGDLKKLKIWF